MYRPRITDELLAAICKSLKTTMTKKQGDAVRFIADECDADGMINDKMFAYILGTCYNECRFKSIPERRAVAGSAVWKLQEKYWYTGYYGRGYSQITWRRNYALFGSRLKIDLVKNPDLALLPEVGAKILVTGMAKGLFTGKKLSDYFGAEKADWMGARSIVNGTLPGNKYGFMAQECADAARKIYDVLQL